MDKGISRQCCVTTVILATLFCICWITTHISSENARVEIETIRSQMATDPNYQPIERPITDFVNERDQRFWAAWDASGSSDERARLRQVRQSFIQEDVAYQQLQTQSCLGQEQVKEIIRLAVEEEGKKHRAGNL